MEIRTNLAAMNANRMFGVVVKDRDKLTERLSSGYRINRSADDAAGLAISEKMRRQIRGLTQASLNAQDGISLIQICDGALNEDHDMLQRINELAIQAANGTNTDQDRAYIDAEVQKIKEELNATTKKVTFNEINLFPDNGYSPTGDFAVQNNMLFEQRFSVSVNPDGVVAVADPMTGAGVGSVTAASGWQNLARHIADELIPNAVDQILNTFPALKTASSGFSDIDIDLKIEYVDGTSNVLAYAGYSYYPGSPARPVEDSFVIKVDSADFNDSVLGTSMEERLESTLAHELTHTIMSNTMTTGMSSTFPSWFIEGTAQLSGGGFTTGWNEYLQMGLSSLTGPDDTSRDSWLASQLRSRSTATNVYGQGYLTTAYLGYVAGGSSEVSSANIAAGINNIFSELLTNGNDLDAAINTVTEGSFSSAAAIAQAMDTATPEALEFSRKLIYASGTGAGSMIAAEGLSAGGSSIVKDVLRGTAVYTIDEDANIGGKFLNLQVGAEAGKMINVKLFQMSTRALGIENTNVATQGDAEAAIVDVKEALNRVSRVRSYYGATQNRLEHTIKNLDNVVENTTAAESQIRDTDMASAMVAYANKNILLQAGQAMLAQANQSHDSVLSLLG